MINTFMASELCLNYAQNKHSKIILMCLKSETNLKKITLIELHMW